MRLLQLITIFLLFFLLCGSAKYAAAIDDAFGFDWDNTSQELINKKGWPTESTALQYIKTIAGQDYLATYRHSKGALYSVVFLATGELEDLPSMLAGHQVTREALALEFGSPEDNLRNKNKKNYDRYVADLAAAGKTCCSDADYIELLKNRDLYLSSKWVTEDALIILILKHDAKGMMKRSILVSKK